MWIYHRVLWYRSSYHGKALVVGPRKTCLDSMMWERAVAEAPAGAVLGGGSQGGSCCPYPGQAPGRGWVRGQRRQRTPPPQPTQGPRRAGLPGKITEVNSHPMRWVCIFAAPLIMKWARRKLFLFIRTEIVCKVLKIKEATAGYFICF